MPVYVTCGGQYGSEGKGLLTEWLAGKVDFKWSTTNCGPNSGHTAVLKNDTKLVTFHLPITGVLQPQCKIFLNSGAIIDPEKLVDEIESIEQMGFRIQDRLCIHPNAAVIYKGHKMKEGEGTMADKISSTQKGVGAALAAKIARGNNIAANDSFLKNFVKPIELMKEDGRIAVEVAQGFSLGINQGFYPFCTSRQCTVYQGLLDAQLPADYFDISKYMVIRTYPIRVGNTVDGYSGGCYADQRETSWENLGIAPEYTTVTGRERRVFTWSDQQVKDAIQHNGFPHVILINFAQYDDDAGIVAKTKMIREFYSYYGLHSPYILLGYGPKTEDMKEWRG